MVEISPLEVALEVFHLKPSKIISYHKIRLNNLTYNILSLYNFLQKKFRYFFTLFSRCKTVDTIFCHKRLEFEEVTVLIHDHSLFNENKNHETN